MSYVMHRVDACYKLYRTAPGLAGHLVQHLAQPCPGIHYLAQSRKALGRDLQWGSWAVCDIQHHCRVRTWPVIEIVTLSLLSHSDCITLI